MQKVLNVIRDRGDGSQAVDWYKDTSESDLLDFIEFIGDDSYQSGDGIQISVLMFPDSWNLNEIVGIYWSDLQEDIDDWNTFNPERKYK